MLKNIAGIWNEESVEKTKLCFYKVVEFRNLWFLWLQDSVFWFFLSDSYDKYAVIFILTFEKHIIIRLSYLYINCNRNLDHIISYYCVILLQFFTVKAIFTPRYCFDSIS